MHARADHELLDGRRDGDLSRSCERADPSADVDGEAGEILADRLTLAGVYAGPQLDPQLGGSIAQRLRTTDGLRWAVEHRQRSIADVLYDSAAAMDHNTIN